MKTIAICASGPSRNRWIEQFNGKPCISHVIDSCIYEDVKTVIIIHKDNNILRDFIKNKYPKLKIVLANDFSYKTTLECAFYEDNNDTIIVAGDLYTLKPENVRRYVDTPYKSAITRYSVPWAKKPLESYNKKFIRRADIGSAIFLIAQEHLETFLSEEAIQKAKYYHGLFWPKETFNIDYANHIGTWLAYNFFFEISSIPNKETQGSTIGSILDKNPFWKDND
tara:strand:- start:1304 stop:1975 length:672 start_codon:yes stop_codon:yes gene_type:complete